MKLLMLIVDKHEIALMVPPTANYSAIPANAQHVGLEEKSSTSASSEKDEFNNSQPH